MNQSSAARLILSMIGNFTASALDERAGSIVWCCMARPASAPMIGVTSGSVPTSAPWYSVA